METLKTIEDVDRLRDNLAKAEVACSTTAELIARVCKLWDDPKRALVVARLLELELSREERLELQAAVRHLIPASEDLSAGGKASADRALKRLLPLLPYAAASAMAEQALDHRRKGRRQMGLAVLGTIGVSARMAKELISRFEQTGDEKHLQLVARSARAMPKVDYRYLLTHLSERYWRMRVFESLLVAGIDSVSELAVQYPFEFVYAAGRIGQRDSLATIRRLLDSRPTALDVLSICAWTLGQLGARDELDTLRRIVNQEIPEICQQARSNALCAGQP